MVRETTVQITVNMAVHTMEREKEGSRNTYLYDSRVKSTGQKITLRFIMARVELKERAKMFIMGKRHINTTKKQIRAITKSVIFVDVDLIITAPYQMPRSPNFFAILSAVTRKITQTTDWKRPIAAV